MRAGTSGSHTEARTTGSGGEIAAARAYVKTRHTYRYDDPAGYRRAVTAARHTTGALADRSQPTQSELRRLRTAQETSTVTVGAAELEVEAPNTTRTRYVTVVFTPTVTYLGGRQSQAQLWTLRLTRPTAAGRWRVDAVVSTS